MRDIRYQPSGRMLHDLGNDRQFRNHLLATGIKVRKRIRDELPAGRTGGRRVAPFARHAFAEIDGTGRDVQVAVGTRWRLGHIIEFGTATSAAFAPLRRAVTATGLRFERGPR